MERRQLGNSDIEVSMLGFGGATLGDEYGTIDAADGIRAVRHAIDRGITVFDVAPYYGRTLAETRMGEALEGRRDEVFLSTKCGRYDVDGFDFSSQRILESIDESLERLRTDHVDLFIVHDIEFGDRRQVIEAAVPAVEQIKAQGKARLVGISGLPIQYLAGVAAETGVDVVLTYAHHNLLVRDLDQYLGPLARRHGLGIINASPLHLGILTEEGPPDWHPAPDEIKEAGRRLAALCRELGTDIVEVALRFAVGHPDVACTLVGMKSVEQVDRNIEIIAGATAPDVLARIEEEVAPILDQSWVQGRRENNP